MTCLASLLLWSEFGVWFREKGQAGGKTRLKVRALPTPHPRPRASHIPHLLARTSAYPAPPRQIRAPMMLLSTPRLPYPCSLPFRCPREVEALTPSSALPLSAHSQPGIPAGLNLAPGRTQSLTPSKARGPRPPSHVPHKPQLSHLAVTTSDFSIIKSGPALEVTKTQFLQALMG